MGKGMTSELQGMAALMTLAFQGADLTPIGSRLIESAGSHPASSNAYALLDLSILLHLRGNHDIALSVQAQALKLRQIYTLPARQGPAIRLLAIVTPGDLSANTPLEFLVKDSDIELTLLYLSTTLPFPDPIPEHDVAFIAVGESESALPLLFALSDLAKIWPRPVLNAPDRIAQLSRNQVSMILQDASGIYIPPSIRIPRDRLMNMALGIHNPHKNILGLNFPVIIRPLDSHAGKGLIKADSSNTIATYLEVHNETEFYISEYVDYCSRDGQFRKYRIVLIDGKPFASHMALSDHWMIHYLNGGMTESAEKREEEARFMSTFDKKFAVRHQIALQTIYERFGLDYLVIDCAETTSGQLLVFEVDSSAVVHAMDSVDMFPYKQPQMQKIFSAFRAMLVSAMARNVE